MFDVVLSCCCDSGPAAAIFVGVIFASRFLLALGFSVVLLTRGACSILSVCARLAQMPTNVQRSRAAAAWYQRYSTGT